MAEIERKVQKVFGGNLSPSGNIAVYGSKLAGSVAYSDNLDTIQNNSWLVGLLGAISPNKAPYVQDLNAIFYVLSKQLAYIFQAGIPEWNSQTEYFAVKSVVRYNGVLFMAIANNTNKTPTNAAYWIRLDNDEFNQTYVTLTDGYPLGKVLRYGRYKIRSLINNNKNAPTGTNVKISDAETGTFYWELVDDIAPGTILPFAGSKIPNGWFLCNGAGKNANDYPFLFRMIGYTYGGSEDFFNLPDFRNKTFWGGEKNEAGTEKTSAIPNHTHGIGRQGTNNTGNTIWDRAGINYKLGDAIGWMAWNGSDSFDRKGNLPDKSNIGALGNNYTQKTSLAHTEEIDSDGVFKNTNIVQPPAIQTPFIIKY